jgi:hypothetical protein
MNSKRYQLFFSKTPAKILLLFVYCIGVNLLAGSIAVWLKFPSLWGGGQIFSEYAMPLPLAWAFAHWPSLILIGISLLLLPHWFDKKYNKIAEIILTPDQENMVSFYKLGEVAQYKEDGKRNIDCYLVWGTIISTPSPSGRPKSVNKISGA